MSNERLQEIIDTLKVKLNDNIKQVIEIFNKSDNYEVSKVIFKELFKNEFHRAVIFYSNVKEELRSELTEEFFNLVIKRNELTNDVINSLVILGEEYHIKYFENYKILLDNILDYDDLVYSNLVGKEYHYYYLNYVEKCYDLTKQIPTNAEKLINSDIKTNKKAQEVIKRIEEKLYNDEKLDELIMFSKNTKTYNNLSDLFNVPTTELYNVLKKKKVTEKTKFLTFSLRYNNEEEALIPWYKIQKERINSRNVWDQNLDVILNEIITGYRIISNTKSISFVNSPDMKLNFNIIKALNDKEISEDVIYDLFYYNTKAFHELYLKPNEFTTFILDYFKVNPFIALKSDKTLVQNVNKRVYKGEAKELVLYDRNLIDFTSSKRVRDYIETKKDEIKEEILILVKKNVIHSDNMVKMYFNSIVKYFINLDEILSAIFNKYGSILLIFDTMVEGNLKYVDGKYFLDTFVGRMPVSFTNNIRKKDLIPGLSVEGNLSSYNRDDKEFRLTMLKLNNNYRYENKYKAILQNIMEKNLINEELLNDDEFLLYSTSEDLISYGYLYKKYNDKFINKEEMLKDILNYKLSLEDEKFISKVFYKYLLNIDKEEIIEELINYIKNLLRERDFVSSHDLINNFEFRKFREKFNLILYYLEDIDNEFRESILSSIKKNKLESITYLYNIEIDNEYFSDINKDYIEDYYKYFEPFSNSSSRLNFLDKDIPDDTKFYILLKYMDMYPTLYYFNKGKLIELFNTDNRYGEWIEELRLSTYRFSDDNIISIISGSNYNRDKLTEEQKEFEEKIKEVVKFKETDITGTNLKDVLYSLGSRINKETIEKLKEISKEELSDEEKLELAPIILDILKHSNTSAEMLYKFLLALDLNNPYNMNNNFTITNFDINDETNEYMLEKLRERLPRAIQKAKFYCISPLHFILDFVPVMRKINKDSIRATLNNYYLHGTINVYDRGRGVRVFLNNVKIKEKSTICDSNAFYELPFRVIPHHDIVRYNFIDLKKDLEIFPIFNFKREEELLNKVLEDNSIFDTLTYEEKRKLLIHYCRYNIVKAYKFDKNKLLSDEEYLDISIKLNMYTLKAPDSLYMFLMLNEKEEFQKSLFLDKDYDLTQKRLLDLQSLLLEYNELDLYDKLIIYLKEMHLLSDAFILSEGKEVMKNRESFKNNYVSYDRENLLEKELLEATPKRYIILKRLYVDKIYYSYGSKANLMYERQCEEESSSDKKDYIFRIYILLKEILDTKEITDEVYQSLDKLYNALPDEDFVKNLSTINLVITQRVTGVESHYSLNDCESIYEKYINIILNDIIKNIDTTDNVKKLVLFSNFFPSLRKKLETTLTKNQEGAKYRPLIKVERNGLYLDFLKKDLDTRINVLNNMHTLSIYDYVLLDFLKELIEMQANVVALDLKDEALLIVKRLKDNNILLGELLTAKFKELLPTDYIELLNQQNDIETENLLKKTLRKANNTYNIREVINSNWIYDLGDILESFNDLNDYYYEFPGVTSYDAKVLAFYRKLYHFERRIIEDKAHSKEKIIIFISVLKRRNLIFNRVLLIDEFKKFFNKEVYDYQMGNILSEPKSKENTLIRKLHFLENNENFELEKEFLDLALYSNPNLKVPMLNLAEKKLQEGKTEQVFYLWLQYIANFPQDDIPDIIDRIPEIDKLIIPPERRYIYSHLIIVATNNYMEEKDAEKLYKLIYHCKNKHAYYPTNAYREIEEKNYDYNFIIEDTTLTNEQKIYLYMHGILKYSIEFIEFASLVYEKDLKENNEVLFDTTYEVKMYVYNTHKAKTSIKINLDLNELKDHIGINIFILVKGLKKLKDKVIVDYDVIEEDTKTVINNKEKVEENENISS